MNRITASFRLKNIPQFKQQMLNWANRFNICCFLDNHLYVSPFQSVECLVGVGTVKTFTAGNDILNRLDDFCEQTNDWLFGHLNYDLKNTIEPLQSNHPDLIGFPDAFFFQPEIVLQLQDEQCTISSVTSDPKDILAQIQNSACTISHGIGPITVQPRISKQDYTATIQQLLHHIRRGDCYEINFCQEFYAKEVKVDALGLYNRLTAVSPNPFSSFYKLEDKYLLCASPERYMQRKGNHIISQPIKGTFKRDLTDAEADNQLKSQLQLSKKDRSENVMIVDLVRNDLSRICKEGSVKVDELFGVYTFPQVHQMISTISGELQEDIHFADMLKASFPMGSMTGAPKRKVMELIEQYEKTKRGIYSGAVGYIRPEKDFDFNVVIRSILYNSSNAYLSYLVGGGITSQSDPEKEYEECLLKAEAMQQVLR